MSASRYAIQGGFNGTSNILSAYRLGLTASGTMAHAYILSHTKTLEEYIKDDKWKNNISKDLNINFFEFANIVLRWRQKLFRPNH